MKVKITREWSPRDAYEIAQFLSRLRFSDMPQIPTALRERLFKNLQQLASVIHTSEVVPNEQRNARPRDPINSSERSRLVDWISGIR